VDVQGKNKKDPWKNVMRAQGEEYGISNNEF